ncbi:MULTISPECIES: sugar ABC transporter ATP-binding protein [Cryobacterium]|uniref:Sugar ABC transporter ATP-binding protein n=1 Tax=Cryobacterium breve TaxID=1259258 RepID=A0ABY2J044_9MICO|nr:MULTISPECIES: sugar ABC transporter ATP-binding protein [Cryobacterium]TFC91781.1 sugar ABC transporter ATP-binding protein [Cryobacterium sp. TmT3-12]TFC98331.1 sugar ABC transporter ATP-binding protein [Cryobacterium breve]
MSSTIALEANGLSKSFPGVKALDRVNLRLMSGETHALMGENGAGKSTLIKILTGVHRPDEGALSVAGSIADIHSPAAAMHAGIGVVHQERNVIRGFTVGENIVMSRMPRRGPRVDWPAVRREAKRCLALLDLELDPDTPMARLSSAQTQLVEIARGLYTETSILLLDEPTASISDNEADRLFRVVRRLTEQGTAVLFVSHKLEEVFAHCDTVSVLRDGRSVLESEPLSAHSRDEIVDVMVGRSLAALEVPERAVDRSRPPVLELSDVDTASGHRGVSLELRSGEILGLYGLVGAGRTELARAVLGLDRVTSGSVHVRGARVSIRSVRQALESYRIGYVTENRKEEGVFLAQSVTRNVAITVWSRLERMLGYVSTKSERALVQKYVTELDIRISGQRQLVGQLSGGNQQKVSLAKWLAAKTEILIIDEPTVGIDVRTKRSFYDLIWKLADDGLAILLISSDLAEMITLADRIAVMDRFAITGEVENSHDYDEMSQSIIRLIHGHAAVT